MDDSVSKDDPVLVITITITITMIMIMIMIMILILITITITITIINLFPLQLKAIAPCHRRCLAYVYWLAVQYLQRITGNKVGAQWRAQFAVML